MNVGIVGLGLIGGSAAMAYKASGHTIYGYDINSTILDYAILTETIDGKLDSKSYPLCQLILIATTPDALIEYIKENISLISPSTLVVDFCGVKRVVCDVAFKMAQEHGFTFVGGHPMAGSQYSGFKYARANLFNNASMIIVPPTNNDIVLLDRVKHALEPMNFKKYMVTTADHHDHMIAYTSQLCHLISNAFVKSPTAQQHRGYSAGSFRDLSRVARLNENMWTELFLDNKEHLLGELNIFLAYLQQYKQSLETGDAEALCRLLREGRVAKEQSEA